VLLGTPSRRRLDDALNRGLCATVSPEPDVDELYVAVRSAFELIEARKRSEARGQWVNRYRNERRLLVVTRHDNTLLITSLQFDDTYDLGVNAAPVILNLNELEIIDNEPWP